MPLEATMSIGLLASYTKGVDLGGLAKDLLDYTNRVQLSTGTGSGQADKLFYDERTISASSNDDLDISGTLIDTFGATFTVARVKGLFIVAGPKDSTATRNTNNVLVGAAGANQWVGLINAAGIITLRPDSVFAAYSGPSDATGFAVTAGTGDILRIANSGAGTSVTYQIAIIASSA